MIVSTILQRRLIRKKKFIDRCKWFRNIRDHSDPFTLPGVQFCKIFRLTKDVTLWLINQLKCYARPTSIPFEIKVLAALHFYGYGSYQLGIGGCNYIGLSQPSTSRAIRLVTKLINSYIFQKMVKFPTTVLERAKTKERFFSKFNMPGILSAIDGSHIGITTPTQTDDVPSKLYYCRKGYYSINLLACCDADGRYTYINAKYPGSCHDASIWNTSKLRAYFRQHFTCVRNQTEHLIGDVGFPIEPWLLNNIANPATDNEHRYNNLLLSARNIIEQSFGRLKGRFRCLSKARTLHYDPGSAGLIINAVAALHNICIDANIPYEDYEFLNEDDDMSNDVEEINNYISEWHNLGVITRNTYLNRL